MLARAMCAELGDRLVICADPGATAIAELGLADRDDDVPHVISRPATYVVDQAGIVRYRYLGRAPEDRPRAELLLLGVESLVRDTPRGDR